MDENRREMNMRRADECLEMIRKMDRNSCTQEQIFWHLRTCLNFRFDIEGETETDFKKLAIISIKKRDFAERTLPEAVIEKRIHQYDCHQISLIAQMKILFIMYVEKKLAIRLDDDKVTETQDLEQFAHIVFQAVTEEG